MARCARAMLAARARGVAIRALVPRAYADAAPAQRLIDAGVPVRVENVHSKWLVVDGRRVVTGSANWSQNAWANNENSLWVDSATVAAAYVARFEQVWAGASGRSFGKFSVRRANQIACALNSSGWSTTICSYESSDKPISLSVWKPIVGFDRETAASAAPIKPLSLICLSVRFPLLPLRIFTPTYFDAA
jgi:hypothetical protein